MKRLRHPIRAIREPFGTAGLIVAMVALVAALGGTALAASKLNGTQKKEVEKIAKKYAGKPGAAGATGPSGSAGAAGKEGPAGANGTGSPGAAGESVTVGAASVAECADGGAKFSNKTGTAHACSAPAGGGLPETLPSDATETGAWVVQGWQENSTAIGAISFPIPLELGLDEGHVVYLTEEESGQEPAERTNEVEVEPGVEKQVGELCAGSPSSPEAARGFLCVYAAKEAGLPPYLLGVIRLPTQGGPSESGAANSGADLFFGPQAGAGNATAGGTWAVTAP
jgi:hypothetical protein